MEDSTTDYTVDAVPDTDDKWLAIATAAFDQSTSYFDSSIRRDIERDLRQFQSLHPRESKYMQDSYAFRARFFRPKTRAAIRKNEASAAAALFTNNDVVSIDPEDQDDKREAGAARLMNELVNLRLRKSIPWFQIALGAYQDALAVGVCISYQSWKFDKVKGIDQPSIELLPIENFRFAPAAAWTDPVNTSPYLVQLIPMYVKDIKARIANDQTKSDTKKWLPVTDGQLLTASKEYTDSISLQREYHRTDPRNQPSAINDYTPVWVHKNIVEIMGVDYVYYTLANVTMLSKPVPLDEVYFHGMRPYAVGNCVLETHKVYPSGISRLTRDSQGEINENANNRLDNVRAVMNMRYFARRNANVDLRSLTRNVPGSVTMMNDPKDVEVVQPKDVTASAYQEQDRLSMDFDDVAGAFSQSSIDPNRRVGETLGGMEMISADASTMGNYQMKLWAETWMKPVIEQLVALIAHYETDERILTLAGRKANLVSEHGVGTIDDDLLATPVQVSVHVGIGATTPQTRLNNFISALKALKEILGDNILIQSGLDIEQCVTEVFSKLGYDSGKRFFDFQQNPQVQSLMQQIQDLQQKLANKEGPPELVQAKITKLQSEAGHIDAKTGLVGNQSTLAVQTVEKLKADKVKTGVDASFAAMQAAEVIAAVPAVAPVADAIMRAAGYEAPIPVGISPDYPTPGAGPAAAAATAAPAVGQPADPTQQAAQAAPAAAANADGSIPSATPGLDVLPIKNRHIGTQFTPGDAARAPNVPPGMTPSTDPMVPRAPVQPASPGTGEERGIETTRFDSGDSRE